MLERKLTTGLLLMFALAVTLGAAASRDFDKRKPVARSADGRFMDFGDGTIVDNQTGLMWMKRDYWQMEKKWVSWYSAQEFVRRMNNKKFAGYSDWRLPAPEEARRLYDRRRRNLDKDGDKIFVDRIFPQGSGWGTWTNQEKGNQAVVVSFKDEGGQRFENKISGRDAFLRLVRGPSS